MTVELNLGGGAERAEAARHSSNGFILKGEMNP